MTHESDKEQIVVDDGSRAKSAGEMRKAEALRISAMITNVRRRRKRRDASPPTPLVGGWAAGVNSVYSTSGGRARATASGGSNPRISKLAVNLEPTVTYRVVTNVYVGTGTGVIWRVSSTQNLDAGDYFNSATFAADTPIDITFEAPAGGEVYIGIVGVGISGTFAETDEVFSLTRVE